MAETCAINFFDPGFLFNFYSDRGSTATHSAHSNVSWCGLRKFCAKPTSAVFAFFSNMWSPVTYKVEKL